ncbi:MAG: zinc dependent phospholipase C family protein [Erysipelotrichaceae bacterium]
MPSITTHYLLGKDALEKVDAALLSIIHEYPKLFNIGTSGPDFFFYYNALPWLDQKEAAKVSHYGSLVHSHYINEFFKEVFTQIAVNKDPAVISHVAGLLCHWAMDKTCHPYIFYQTEGDKLSAYYHRQFESTLDTLILNKLKNINLKDFKPYDIVVYDETCVDGIYNAYQSALNKVFDIQLEEKIVETALKHFYQAQKLLYDKQGFKKKNFEKIEKHLLKKPFLLSCMMAPTSTVDEYDILNLSHQVWRHPVTGMACSKSFLDLYQESLDTAQTVLHLFNQFLNDNQTMPSLLAYIDNQSFETGLSTYQELAFNDCIYTR